ncbi:MAG TPA: transposase [Steroidobacteraceae bacterium]|jgi:putative transposase|nr:transposase [Steroidobacteraceae bacterium]
MPRTARFIVANYCYHVLNRANKKARIFHSPADYEQFLALVHLAQQRVHVPILAACVMPNHFHLVMRPTHADDLARWMQWAFTTHVRWHHAKYDTTGRLWQGRFKAFLIQQDHHLLTVMRYVERNALRAKLAERAEDWRWGSLAWRAARHPPVDISESPVPLPGYWRHLVNEPQTSAELEEIRTCVNRQRPFGEPRWVEDQARALGIEQSLKPFGRPRKSRSVPVC